MAALRPPSDVERTVSLAEAEQRAMTALDSLGLHATLSCLSPDTDPTAWRCLLHASSGAPVPEGVGCGKGHRQEARVGAMFEAMEHHFSGPGAFNPPAVSLWPAAALAQDVLADDVVMPVLSGLAGQQLACHAFAPMAGRSQTAETAGGQVPVPLFLTDPWYVDRDGAPARRAVGDTYDYLPVLARYSCNSGSAIGVGAAEAGLHALNEVIERDAFSLLLTRAFLGRGYRPTVVDTATLPADLAAAHALAERLAGQPVHLLDITTDLGVPARMAYAVPGPEGRHRRGTGVSLNAHYAAWRALTEFVQGILVGDHAGFADLSPLSPYQPLLACGRFDLTSHLSEARLVPYTPPDTTPAGHPVDQLRVLVDRLTAAGHHPYQRIVADLPGGVTVVKVLVPGLERFMLVTQGALVLPGRRARHAVTATTPRRGSKVATPRVC
ncbi:YcaO-like family protein [Nonomuraea sp. NPDC050451]|uniref:YcaO-like family protein n=1 Tax=Nonomuraea sp. NPDC050451 TaxID=3364364 RepID=UPI0037899D0B